mgnify:CR=1 FL=1|jgi:hypothetical protein
MVVTVVPVWVMKAAVDYVVGMVTMGHSLVPATRPVDMGIVVLDRLASVRIRLIDLQLMLVIVVAVLVVHVPAMQVVGVIPMSDLGVTTVLAMLMVMILMDFTIIICHFLLPNSPRLTTPSLGFHFPLGT